MASLASTSSLCSRTIDVFPFTHKLPKKAFQMHRRLTKAQCCQRQSHDIEPCTTSRKLELNRREAMKLAILASLPLLVDFESDNAKGAGLPTSEPQKLCDDDCEKDLEKIPMSKTASGLEYKDIVTGKGPSPPIGFQVAANYVAMIPSGKVFDSSLDKGVPYIFRVGAGQVVKGLDEGILSMKVGGKRRLYIPGELAFPKGLNAAAGRPRVPPSSPVIFDVSLEYIPGLDDYESD